MRSYLLREQLYAYLQHHQVRFCCLQNFNIGPFSLSLNRMKSLENSNLMFTCGHLSPNPSRGVLLRSDGTTCYRCAILVDSKLMNNQFQQEKYLSFLINLKKGLIMSIQKILNGYRMNLTQEKKFHPNNGHLSLWTSENFQILVTNSESRDWHLASVKKS